MVARSSRAGQRTATQSPTAGRSRRDWASCRIRPGTSARVSSPSRYTRKVAPYATATRAGCSPSAREGSNSARSRSVQPSSARVMCVGTHRSSTPGSRSKDMDLLDSTSASVQASHRRLAGIQIDWIQRHVPVGHEQLETAALLFPVRRLVGIHLRDELLFGWSAGRANTLHELDDEGPISAPVAVVLWNPGAHRYEAARLLFCLEQRVVVSLEQVKELVLRSPLHGVEVPGGLRRGRRGRCWLSR